MILRNNVQAVVFDMDGVLIDSHPVHRIAWRQFLRSVGHDVSDDNLPFILEGRTRNEILRHFLGELSEEDLQAYGKRKDEIFRSLEHQIGPVAGAIEFLKNLCDRGIACAVATSASEIRTFCTIERMGVSDCFEAVVTASDVMAGKPDPMVYQLACQRLQVATERALAFDDAPAGIQAAKAAGMRCIGVSSNGLVQQLLDAGAENVVPNFVGLCVETLEKVCSGHHSLAKLIFPSPHRT